MTLSEDNVERIVRAVETIEASLAVLSKKQSLSRSAYLTDRESRDVVEHGNLPFRSFRLVGRVKRCSIHRLFSLSRLSVHPFVPALAKRSRHERMGQRRPVFLSGSDKDRNAPTSGSLRGQGRSYRFGNMAEERCPDRFPIKLVGPRS